MAEQHGEPSGGYSQLPVTIVFISNLQCPSCVQRIEQALDALFPKPSSVSISIISHSVTIRHNNALDSKVIVEALEAEGFEIHKVLECGQPDIENVDTAPRDRHSAAW